MGQIFTWHDVLEGNVPEPQDFAKVVDILKEDFKFSRRADAIQGALICGSVTRGDYNIRSDIDCFVVYDKQQEQDAFRFMQKMSSVARILHVPLCFIPCDSVLVRTRMHHIGPSFFRHLERSVEAGGLLKGKPLAVIQNTLSEKEELEGYLRVKMYNLQEGLGQYWAFSNEHRAQFLKKLLEAPMHVARKTLARLGFLEEDSKAYIRERYTEVMPAELSAMLQILIDLDLVYTRYLQEQLNAPDEESYTLLLTRIVNQAGLVLSFVRANLYYVHKTAR
jgi:predicted nucleotidyltransferase